MRAQSVIRSTFTTISHSVTVAAGVFAPGHLGELTRIVPFELVGAVLADTGRVERWRRMLPSRVGLYLVLALALFPQLGYQGVWAKLTAALDGQAACPSNKALRDLRRRPTAAPVKALFELLAGPLGYRCMPGVYFAGYCTVAFAACRSIKVPDTDRNRGWLGKLKAALGQTGYPAIQLMTLMETGTGLTSCPRGRPDPHIPRRRASSPPCSRRCPGRRAPARR